MDELISRQAAIDTVMECYDNDELLEVYVWKLNELPPIQPDIVRCEECLYRKICSWEKQGAKFCSFCGEERGEP